jgi:concentrative nucleoside transporter, CNT family
MERFTGIAGLVLIVSVAWLFSAQRRAIKGRVVFWGLTLQFAFAVLVLKTGFGRVFQAFGSGVNAMLEYAEAGSQFVFGPLGEGRAVRRGVRVPGAADRHLHRLVFCHPVLLRVMQLVVRAMAVAMQKVMGNERRGVHQRCRQHLHGADRSAAHDQAVSAEPDEIRAVRGDGGGMAHVSGAVMAAYVKIAGVDISTC